MKITSPSLVLNESICRQNIRTMVAKAANNHLSFRPHFKTHQSHEIGQWFRAEGVKQITVSSVKMAEYFAADGWQDITIAFPFNVLELDRLQLLAQKITVNILIESVQTIQAIAPKLKFAVGVFIKIDVGTHRTGINADKPIEIDQLLAQLAHFPILKFKGFLAHAGHSYLARSIQEIQQVHLGSIQIMRKLKSKYKDKHPDLLLSVGDTPTCSQADDFLDMDEIRPGNFAFYDVMQAQICACDTNQIAVAMACPIVALHPERGEIVIYGGGVHFSKESLIDEKIGQHFGLVVAQNTGTWGNVVENTFLHRISQEHGIVKASKAFIANHNIGDLLYILPIHSCMTANLMKEYLTLEGKVITMMQ